MSCSRFIYGRLVTAGVYTYTLLFIFLENIFIERHELESWKPKVVCGIWESNKKSL